MNTFQLSDTLKPLPRSVYTKSTTPMMTLTCTDRRTYLSLNRAAIRALGLDWQTSNPVCVHAGTRQIGVQATAAGPHTMSAKGTIQMHILREILHLKDGDSFQMAARIVDGMLVATFPDTLQTRINYHARKNGRGA